MEVNRDKMDYLVTLSDSIEQSPPSTTIKEGDKENRLSLEDERRSDHSLFDMIKSRPKRTNRKVPSRLRPPNDQTNTGSDQPKSNQSTRPTDNSSLDVGLDTFFESSSSVLKRRTFADVYPKEEVPPRASSKSLQNSVDHNDRNNNEETNNNHDKGSKLCPLSVADRIARSRSSPNLIDPKKMLLPGDPRLNLSMIKELRSKQKSGESTETLNNNNRNHHPSFLTELKAKNSPIRSLKDAPSLVHRDKPPISHLKPCLKPSSSGSSSLAPSVQQSGQFFNVMLRETKSNKMNSLTKSHTRASFPVTSGNDYDGKRISEPNCYQDKEKGEDKDSESVADDVKLSKEGSAVDAGESEDEKGIEDDDRHENGTETSDKVSC